MEFSGNADQHVHSVCARSGSRCNGSSTTGDGLRRRARIPWRSRCWVSEQPGWYSANGYLFPYRIMSRQERRQDNLYSYGQQAGLTDDQLPNWDHEFRSPDRCGSLHTPIRAGHSFRCRRIAGFLGAAAEGTDQTSRINCRFMTGCSSSRDACIFPRLVNDFTLIAHINNSDKRKSVRLPMPGPTSRLTI